MDITFNKKLFTSVFWRIKQAKNRFVMVKGGAGTSKSVSQAQNEIIRMLEGKEKTLVTRKVGTTLKDSVVSLVIEQINEWGISSLFKYNKTDKHLYCIHTGSEMLFKGMDDREKIKSINGLTRIWCEEVTEFDQDDIDQLNLRGRGVENFQLIGTFNPISEDHWIKAKFYDTNRDDTDLIDTHYTDNQFLDEDYINTLLNYRTSNPYMYMVYVQGKWGVLEVENPWAYSFNPNTHVDRAAIFDEFEPIWISFDFNLNPLTCVLAHISPNGYVHVFDEIEERHNNLPGIIDQIKLRYGKHLHKSFVTGDAMGRNGDLSQRDNAAYYEQIRRGLGISKSQIKVPKSNPNHKTSRLHTNLVLSRHPNVIIHPNCATLVRDLQIVQADVKGGIIKKNRSKIEQQADMLDNFRYLVNTVLLKWCVKNSI